MWIFPWIKLVWHSCSIWDELGWLSSGNFFERVYLPLTRKDSITHVHGLEVYVKKVLLFVPDLSLETSADSYLCFWLALLHSLPYFFFLCPSPYSSLCAVFSANSSDIDEALLIRPSANAHHRNWLNSSNGSDIIFLSQMPLLRWLTFLLGYLDCDCHSSGLLDVCFSSNPSICATVTFPPLGNFDHVVVSVSIDFPSNSKGDAPYHRTANDYSCVDCDGFVIIKEMFSSVQSIRWSLIHVHGFQLLVLLPWLVEITSLVFTNRINHLHLKWISNRLISVAKVFLKLPNLHMPKNESIFSQKHGSCDFW